MGFTNTDLDRLRHAASKAAVEAGEFIMSQRGSKLAVDLKQGGESYGAQVVTEVDRGSQEVILEALQSETQTYQLGILSEEMPDTGERFESEAFWCIDPLDGTLPFIQGKTGFAVSIALVSREGNSLVGVIYDPVSKTTYASSADGTLTKNQSPWSPLRKDPSTATALTVVADESLRSHSKYKTVIESLREFALARGLDAIEIKEGEGAAMNVCEVLEESPACYFKFPKKESGGGCLWDFAASACLMQCAGGAAISFSDDTLDLNNRESLFLNHCGVIYASDAELAGFIKTLL